uniref:Acyl-(Acyl-carrier-protein)--UDP-N-acetylglucosamine O-acyltransferase n=1 Tax=Aegilops tauschii TaxID=37682 RepID=M8CUS2_AEGTA
MAAATAASRTAGLLLSPRLLIASRHLQANLPGRTIIGENNVIGNYAVVGVKCQDLKYKNINALLLLFSQEMNVFYALVIGDNNLIMGSCHVAHDCKIGSNNIFANNTLFGGHVIVEDCTHTAGAVVVHQFCHIGSFSFLGGGSVVAQDVPRYTMVAGDRAELRGLNLEGLRRNGFSDQEVRSLRKAYRKVFMPASSSQSNFEDRLAELEICQIPIKKRQFTVSILKMPQDCDCFQDAAAPEVVLCINIFLGSIFGGYHIDFSLLFLCQC